MPITVTANRLKPVIYRAVSFLHSQSMFRHWSVTLNENPSGGSSDTPTPNSNAIRLAIRIVLLPGLADFDAGAPTSSATKGRQLPQAVDARHRSITCSSRCDSAPPQRSMVCSITCFLIPRQLQIVLLGGHWCTGRFSAIAQGTPVFWNRKRCQGQRMV